jgi:hypothetical protein
MKWKYFKYSESWPSDVYRWPDNGKSFDDQIPADVEVYQADGSWLGPRKSRLYAEYTKGWFSEHSDQIDEGEALILMANVTERAKEKALKGDEPDEDEDDEEDDDEDNDEETEAEAEDEADPEGDDDFSEN